MGGLEREIIIGVNSDIDDDHHVLMIDYDDRLSYETLKLEIVSLQERFNLGKAWIIETSYKHYSVFFFEDIFNYWRCLEIIHSTSSDPKFKRASMIYPYMTIRISKKRNKQIPKLLEILPSKNAKCMNDKQNIFMNEVLKCLK